MLMDCHNRHSSLKKRFVCFRLYGGGALPVNAALPRAGKLGAIRAESRCAAENPTGQMPLFRPDLWEVQCMNLFRVADDYCRASSWKTLALVKFCLFSMGIIAGVLLARLGWDEATDPIWESSPVCCWPGWAGTKPPTRSPPTGRIFRTAAATPAWQSPSSSPKPLQTEQKTEEPPCRFAGLWAGAVLPTVRLYFDYIGC